MKKYLSFICLLLIIFLVGCGSNSTTTSPSTTTNQPTTTKDTTSMTQANPTTTNPADNFVFDEETYLEGLNDRREYLINYFNTNYYNIGDAKVGFGITAVRMLTYLKTGNEEDLQQALKNLESCIGAAERAQNSCFPGYQFMTFYILFKDYIGEELLARYENLIKTYQGYGYNSATFNHTLLAAVGRYLAEQEFPGEIQTNYLGFKNNDPTDHTGEKAIRKVLEEYPSYGIFEYNSDTYYVCHLIAFLTLYLCAKDEEIKTLSKMVLENGIFNMAPIYLNGHLCIPQERTYMPYESQNYNASTNLLLWYYYGGDREYPVKKDLDFVEASSIAYFVYSDFIPNWISAMMATDRSETYIHKEMHHVEYEGRTVFLESYMKDTYSVFSGITGMQHVQSFNWGVRYESDDPEYWSTFSIQNLNNIDTDRATKFGSSDYMNVLQHENTVVGVFYLSPDATYRNIVLYEPANYKAIIDESYLGRLYLHYGSVIIAFQLSQPFVNTIEETNYGDKVRCNNLTNGKGWFVCEVFDPREIDEDSYMDQLYYVQSLCEGNFKKVNYTESNVFVEYKDTRGNTLSLKYSPNGMNSNKTINGEVQKYSLQTYPLQLNPWVEQYAGDKVITYTYKNHSITFDFENMTTTYQ